MRYSLLLVSFAFSAAVAHAQIREQTIITRGSDGLGNSTTHCPALSGDARFTIFESFATNLVMGDTNDRSDLFLYDDADGSVRRLSQNSRGGGHTGGENPTTCSSNISRDGSTVVYATDGADLVDGVTTNVSRIYAINTRSRSVELLTPQAFADGAFFPSVSQDGSKVAFISSDLQLDPRANGLSQAYLLDRSTGALTMLSVDAAGNAGNGDTIRTTVSHDGKWVVFPSKATNLRGAEGQGAEGQGTADSFQIFLLNLETGEHQLVSRSAAGAVGNQDSFGAVLSADGGTVVFFTTATNLVPEDTRANGEVLAFSRDRGTLEVVGVSTEGKRIPGFHEILGNAVSADGNLVMFRALIGSFDTFRIEVYVRDRANRQTYLSSFSDSCAFGTRGGDSHSGSIAPDAPTLAFAVGKDTRRSPLQLALVDLDVLQSISAAPRSLDTPDADVCGSTATLAMTPFTVGPNGEALPLSIVPAAAGSVTYETRLMRSNRRSEVRRLTSKRNLLTVSRLAPGTYRASYRVSVRSPSGVTRSGFSKPVKFRIK